MRSLILLFAAFPVFAQTPNPPDPTMQKLLAEIQQLRIAIQQSTLLGARTQLAISQLQMEDAKVSKLSADLAELRGRIPSLASQKAQFNERIKAAEEARTRPEFASDPAHRQELESNIKQMKIEMEQAGFMETQLSAREAELASQLTAANAQAADARSRIAQMERALDEAIRQLTAR